MTIFNFRRRQPTLRARLTLIYGGLFLAAGLVVVALMYLLVRYRLAPTSAFVIKRTVRTGDAPFPPTPGRVVAPSTQVEQAINEYNDGTLSSLLQYSVLLVAVILVVATGIGWLMAGRTLRSVREITATARRVADRNLHERISLNGPPDELKELADTFDAMLERLDQAFAGQRRFAANASHELRTPLAINRTLLEVALGDPDSSADVRQLIQALLATNERSERLIDGLLTLSSSENELPLRVPVDLADVVNQALEQLSEEATQRSVSMRTRLVPTVVDGDGVLLERLALNLVQNGIRHNAGGDAWVEVATGQRDGWAELLVTNTGATIPANEVNALFEPFRRLHAERTASDGGVGLGLSIARSVARAHGGNLTASPRDGGGLIVRATLPLSAGPG